MRGRLRRRGSCAAQKDKAIAMILPLSWQPEPIAAMEAAIRANRAFLDASDTGTGKTFVTVLAAKAAEVRLGVVCPKSVIPAWHEAAELAGVPVEFVRNIESLKAERPERYLRKFGKSWQWRVPAGVKLVFDEVHRHAGQTSDNAKILAAAPPSIMLSATAANSPLQMRAIGSQLGLTTWGDWWGWCLKNGCRPGDFGGLKFVGGTPVLDRLHRQIFHTGRGIRVRVADLPAGVFPDNLVEVVGVPVDKQEALDEAYMRELALLKADAAGILPELTRSRQMSEHLKLPAMIEMASDALAEGHSVALFVNFRDSLQRLCSHRWGFPIARIDGEQTSDERETERMRFQTDYARVIAVMIQAGGHALSLHDVRGEFPRLGLHSPGWSARELLQALGRLPRAGAKSNVIQRILFAAGTIEDRMRKRTMSKAHDITTLNDGDLSAA